MSKNFLDDIIARKRQVLSKERADINALRARALEVRQKSVSHRFRQVLQDPLPHIKIIAEFKRRSPSLGIIRADLTPSDVARGYERGGACAISVLTDEDDFSGSIVDLGAVRSTTQLPILRKDFIIEAMQIYEAAAAGADAVLLIVAALDCDALGKLRRIAEEELGLDALVEAHTSMELRQAIDSGASIIGVNNRDLHTFEVSVSTSERLIVEAPPETLMVSESGLQDPASLSRLCALGFRGFLIGEALLSAKDPEAALRDLIAGAEERQTAALAARQP